MQKVKKSAVSVLLSVLLLTALFAAIPMTALAADGECTITDGSYTSSTHTSFADAYTDSGIDWSNPVTITLLGNCSYDDMIVTGVDESLTIDLNGFTLTTGVTAGGAAIYVDSGGTFTVKGPGTLNATASGGTGSVGIYVDDGTFAVSGGAVVNATGETAVQVNNGKATVTTATATSYGVLANGSGTEVAVTGNVTCDGADARGLAVQNGATVTVEGSVSVSGGDNIGVDADNGSEVYVGTVTVNGDDSIGVRADNDSIIDAGSVTVTGQNSLGVQASGEGWVTVGAVTASGAYSNGVRAFDQGSLIEVGGNVNSTSYAVDAWDGATLKVGGSVTSTALNEQAAVYCNGALIEIKGDVKADGQDVWTAVYCEGGGEVKIGGSVISKNHGVTVGSSNGLGGEVTVDGSITVPSSGNYIELFDTAKTKSQNTKPTTKAGYLTYTENNDGIIGTVWVKAPASSGGSSSSTTTVPKTGDSTNMISWGIALALSVMGVCALPVAKKRFTK